ncbi:hypothetical protein P3655_06450 [Vibrio parahaemolyticus]|uniref:hypothetical protein n=1 Tax=Vibrio parahaemolyticus TaxID=670 RepID=UPI00146E76FD|nr:hypothetical protein [Vibrio parahaemolyticus]MDF5121845.1 hypothetical protein [Vibrio parahaemolyticus]MDF5224649.1 hypothetical protein [Vibrio parahaemolyticus]MDF5680579.1 hypothetical protein [Vibrio parahaemolyticus]NMT60288.1 hypothetical protein [Vibrio parahaemolyticus]NMU10040.1 hypothetical protein [Vibrio parahaemolyticus]
MKNARSALISALIFALPLSANAFFGSDELVIEKNTVAAPSKTVVQRKLYYISDAEIQQSKKAEEFRKIWTKKLRLTDTFTSIDQMPKVEDFPSTEDYKQSFSENNGFVFGLIESIQRYKNAIVNFDQIMEEYKYQNTKDKRDLIEEYKEELKVIKAESNDFFNKIEAASIDKNRYEKLLIESQVAIDSANEELMTAIKGYAEANSIDTKKLKVSHLTPKLSEKACKGEGYVANEKTASKNIYYTQVNPTLCVEVKFFSKLPPEHSIALMQDEAFVSVVDKYVGVMVQEMPHIGKWKMKNQAEKPDNYKELLKVAKKEALPKIKAIEKEYGVLTRMMEQRLTAQQEKIDSVHKSIAEKDAEWDANIEVYRVRIANRMKERDSVFKNLYRTAEQESKLQFMNKVVVPEGSQALGKLIIEHDDTRPTVVIVDRSMKYSEVSTFNTAVALKAKDYIFNPEKDAYDMDKLINRATDIFTRKSTNSSQYDDSEILSKSVVKQVHRSEYINEHLDDLTDEKMQRLFGNKI